MAIEPKDQDIDDVLDEFRTAVENGQVRLALIHLVDIIDTIVDVLTVENGDSDSATVIPPVVQAVNQEQEKQPEAPKPAKKTATPTAEKEVPQDDTK